MKLLSRGFSNVVLPFFHTVRTFLSNCCSHFKLHSHVDEKRVRARAQVRCSDFVGSDFPHSLSMFDKLLHLSKSESFAMSCSRRCDLCEAIGNLLTVSTCTFKIRCPCSIAQTCIKATFLSTWRLRRLAPLRFTNPRAAELSVHSTIVPGEHLHNLLDWSLVAIPSQAPPNSAISSDSPELKRIMFSL